MERESVLNPGSTTPQTSTPGSKKPGALANEALKAIEPISRTLSCKSSSELKRKREENISRVTASLNVPRFVVEQTIEKLNAGATEGARGYLRRYYENPIPVAVT